MEVDAQIIARPAPLARYKFALAIILIGVVARLLLSAMPRIDVR